MMIDSALGERSRREALLQLLETRRSLGSTFLTDPGPSPDELQRLLTIGVRVPDHGMLEPWRLILIEGDARGEASERLAAAYEVDNAEMESERRAKFTAAMSRVFTYAPLVVVVVMRPDTAATIPLWEQDMSAGAVCMNLLTAAHAMGFGAVWLSGWATRSQSALGILGLGEGESVAGILHIGTAKERPADRKRPDLERIVTRWQAAGA